MLVHAKFWVMAMRAAVLQLNSQDKVSANLLTTAKLVQEAAQRGAELILLPEGFAFLGAEAEKAKIAESLSGSGQIMQALRAWAKSHHIYLIAGGMAELSDDSQRPFNSSLVLNPRGEVIAVYRKMHLFDIDLPGGPQLFESRATSAGSELVVADLEGLALDQVGLSICYDLRFPELFAQLVKTGAQVLTIPAAFTETTGKAHWEVLLRARAIETQSYVLAATQWGEHPGARQTFGHASIIDPWGRVLAEKSHGVGVVIAELDKKVLDTTRSQMPLSEHRRLTSRS